MSARAIASGNISFGLVSIPIKLYSASNTSAGISFNMLHAKCGSRLKQQYLCAKDNEVVPREEITKGYEFAKDRYVVFTPEELKSLEEQSTQSIEVVEFVPITAVDPVYYDKPYYLGPDKGGAKAYHLLAEVLKETGRVALGKYAARGKQYLVMIRPMEEGLVMQQLLYADEVRPFSEVPLEKGKVNDAELDLAKRLVEQRTSDAFRPEAYEDEVVKRIREQLNRKMEGEEISLAPPETGAGQIIDLMEALKASLSREGRPSAAKTASPAARRSAAQDRDAERRPARRATLRAVAKEAKSSKK